MDTLAYILVLNVLVGVSASCPNGWTRHNSVCYHFSHDVEDWPGAKTICSVLGGALVEINDASESAFISGQSKVLNKYLWLSLTDLLEEGIWQWMGSSTPLNPSLANWSTGHPNGKENQNCAYVHIADGRWDDAACNHQFNYVCEKDDTESSVIG